MPGKDSGQHRTDALSWFRSEVCGDQGHTHGPEGELDCLLTHLAMARAGEAPAAGDAL